MMLISGKNSATTIVPTTSARKTIIIGSNAAVIAAVITPTPDMMTQIVFAVPMIALYLLGVLIAWMFRRRSA